MDYVQEYIRIKKENKDLDGMSNDEYQYLHEIKQKARETILLTDREFLTIIKMRMLEGIRDDITSSLNKIHRAVRELL